MSEPELDRSRSVRSGEELPVEGLSIWLSEHLGASEEALEVEQFPAGHSNLTYALRWAGRELVLRRPPIGARVPRGHDMGREYRVLAALHPVFPKVPEPIALCEESELIGAPFYVMERLEGLILRSRKPKAPPSSDGMAGLSRATIELLAEIHAVDYKAEGLQELGHPEGYIRRQVVGWSKRYLSAKTDDVPALEWVAAWLTEQSPKELPGTLIHNDFKYDNLLLDPADRTNIRAVLDWEMATLGDPLMDLGTTLGYWTDPDDPPEILALPFGPSTLPGNLSRIGVVEHYVGVTGRQPEQLVFYYAYGLFKIAVIVQQIYARFVIGHTKDPRFAGFGRVAAVLAGMAQRAIERDRIDALG